MKPVHFGFFLTSSSTVISILDKNKRYEVAGPITVLETVDMVMRKRRQKIIRYHLKKLIKRGSQSDLDLIPK